MRNKVIVPLLALVLVACAGSFASAQQDPNEENVRGAFLSTRVNASAAVGSTGASSSTGTSRTRRRKPTTSRTTSKGTTAKTGTGKVGVGTTKSATASNGTSGIGNGSGKAYAGAPIGLGYSLFMRDAYGDPVRVDPARTFRAGDGIRLSLETNTDGYLYIFHTENNANPQMLYPSYKLDEGDNFVEAHVPYEIPWSGEVAENLRWFFFDKNPANERLYIVLSREPLPGVPTNEQLVSYCRGGQPNCTWRPDVALLSQLNVKGGKVVVNKKAATYGQKQTASERDATTRGLGLGTSEPEPSIVRMNVSSDAAVLVTALDLIHQ